MLYGMTQKEDKFIVSSYLRGNNDDGNVNCEGYLGFMWVRPENQSFL